MSYRLADPVPRAVLSELSDVSPLTARLLYNRGITTRESAHTFLNPDYAAGRHDPFLLHDMEAAVTRILRALQSNERVVVYSDYDCDGIPGAVILHDFFAAIGYGNVEHYIPHRHFEGFGFSTYAVEKIKKTNATLLITIDCGTVDHEAIRAAKAAGIDVIVTDHHEPDGMKSAAVALVNPKIGGYPFADLCNARECR